MRSKARAHFWSACNVSFDNNRSGIRFNPGNKFDLDYLSNMSTPRRGSTTLYLEFSPTFLYYPRSFQCKFVWSLMKFVKNVKYCKYERTSNEGISSFLSSSLNEFFRRWIDPRRFLRIRTFHSNWQKKSNSFAEDRLRFQIPLEGDDGQAPFSSFSFSFPPYHLPPPPHSLATNSIPSLRRNKIKFSVDGLVTAILHSRIRPTLFFNEFFFRHFLSSPRSRKDNDYV